MNAQKKSRTLAVLLAVFLGPLGVLYASGIGGLILIVLTIATAPTVVFPICLWVIGWIVADSAVAKHNAAIDEFMLMMTRR